MEESDIKPWYKQFWPWFLICIPLSSFIVGGFVVSFATDGTNTLVVDDYYKEGKAINERLGKIEEAQTLNITTQLNINNDFISVEFLSGAPQTKQALKLDFYHVTLAERDFQVLLSADANGIYRAETDTLVNGKWRLRLTPLDESWKVQKTLILPTSMAISFNP
ncbi:FixH family protein [Brumicola pallidula]|jgi:hypothetical protein|uniref:FixH family protein n=1 Tax=Brumicola pallidula DSM 14239 = ACAM 615 TaxID=1121922 RepID=K7A1D4_9ALTE|nr:FixH family protein [Glaciecola pallidula]GAC29295.1 hypothetical protein GPAL_2434 [Glaciecola pallidula DSM 14239 = ACAM 615]